MNNLQRWG